ncbi:MAG: FAD-binding oxidoreductase [Ignavibacteriales bacterium]|nr:MAG: FAD-binding oxidoreductase [Ignavibacteriaceae bacterium]MBW7873477.1 FAD-binding oxidoreductase [Ignavibacteria bacterium]MCZ2142168.1 FAD-binding oxidoreductase [Ignavibacteriales bacterium]MBV6444904.1 putative FAD-linked oxidoreductase [Ignavibacteriaceae bacterium]MBZ0197078.1 FAD-binding oxidoreductase [Ignavibacteriaceae bacterium]
MSILQELTPKTEYFEDFLHDASNYRGYGNAVYFPADYRELARIVKELYEEGTKFTISGARTGLTGGCVPEGGVVISTEKMSHIIEFDSEARTVSCEPGVLLYDLQKFLREKGFFFPSDPTETFCTVGGVVSNNSSGARSFRYGAARNYVKTLFITLSNGDFFKLKRGECTERNGFFTFRVQGKTFNLRAPRLKTPGTKNAAGYFCRPGSDLVDLFTGSEGTLGIISRVKLEVLPLPEKLISCVVFFRRLSEALGFAALLRNTPKDEGVRAIEFFDENALNFLKNDFPNTPEGNAAAVWFEVETNYDNFDADLLRWSDRITEGGAELEEVWYPADEAGIEEIKKFRHAISARVNEYIAKHGLRKLGTDTAVPPQHFDDYYRWAVSLVEEAGLNYVAYGHFGDCHLHLNMLPKDDDEYAKGKAIYFELCKRAVELEGTVSAEHGIGKLKKEYLKLMYGPQGVEEMKRVKRYLDSKNLLNAGNLFDL